MSQTVTTTDIRLRVVKEAIHRATRECLFLFVYEYKGTISDNTVWATLPEGEQPPKDSLLLCTVNPDGIIDWKINDPDLIQSHDAKADQTHPIEGVTFNNVSITIAANDPAAAYSLLCEALAKFDYATDTFCTYRADEESDEQCTSVLFPSHSQPAPNRIHSPRAAATPVEKELLIFIVEFCSERLEWFCSDCYRDSAEIAWLENARSHLGYPPLDFARIRFLQQPLSGEPATPTYFVIQSREASEDGEWEEWSRDTDPADLLRLFVNSVSSEEIDDVNRYWRVRETLDPDNLTHDDNDA